MPGKSLEQLEGEVWSASDCGLGQRCDAVRKKPLEAVTPGEMAMLIRQQMSHPLLVPLAVALLEREPLMDSDLYEGELLSAVLGVGRSFWEAHPDLARRMLRAANAAYATLAQVQPRATGGIEHQLMAEIKFFREKCARSSELGEGLQNRK